MDENNQYGNAVTKPLPYGCKKKVSKVPFLLEFNMILDNIWDTDKVGHLFIVDINFTIKMKKQCFLMKYTPPFLKKKVIQMHQRSEGVKN